MPDLLLGRACITCLCVLDAVAPLSPSRHPLAARLLAARWSKTKQAGSKAVEGGNRPTEREMRSRAPLPFCPPSIPQFSDNLHSSSSSSSIVTMYTIPSLSSSTPRRTRRSRTTLALAAAAATAASLLTATPAVAQDLTGNLTSLTGTWSSGTGAVLTGPVSGLSVSVTAPDSPSHPFKAAASALGDAPSTPARPRVSVASHGAPFSAGQRQHSSTTQRGESARGHSSMSSCTTEIAARSHAGSRQQT